MKTSNIASLDLGNNKIAALVGSHGINTQLKIISGVLHSAAGIKDSTVTDIKLVEESILNAVYSLEQKLGYHIKDINLTFGKAQCKSHYIYEEFDLPDSRVTQNNVDTLVSRAIKNVTDSNHRVLHCIPLEFILDNQKSIVQPVGMKGEKLGCRLHVVLINQNILSNTLESISRCQLHVKNIMLDTYATALSCLTPSEKKSGALLIDFGYKSTGFCIYFDNKPLHFGSVPIGSHHISQDISQAFGIDIAFAEKLKVLYGSALDMKFSESDKVIQVSNNGDEESDQGILERDLLNVIIPRVEEIFEMVQYEFKKSQFDNFIARNLVLAGNGSQINHLSDYTQKLFQMNVRIANPHLYSDNISDHEILSYSSALGCIQHTIENQDLPHKDIQNHTTSNDKKSIFNKVISWFKEAV